MTTASDGKIYKVTYYALPMVLAVGFRVRSIRGSRKNRGILEANDKVRLGEIDFSTLSKILYKRQRLFSPNANTTFILITDSKKYSCF